MPDDQTTRKVQHREIRVGALFPSDQQASIAIEPTMRAFDDPAPRPCSVTHGLALIPTTSNPRHHADLPDMVVHTTTDIAQIQAQPRTWRSRLLMMLAKVSSSSTLSSRRAPPTTYTVLPTPLVSTSPRNETASYCTISIS